ncbi:MAG: hypothetical protein WDM70_04065 [Nitrosomonadales bacterium]
MSAPEQEYPDQQRIERNVRHTTGIHALKKIRGIVDEDLREEAARTKLLRTFLRYGWVVLLLAAWLLARHFGVI